LIIFVVEGHESHNQFVVSATIFGARGTGGRQENERGDDMHLSY